MFKIGFVGFGSHAARLEKCLRTFLGSFEIIRYHPTKRKANTTNCLEDLYACDFVFITSPNQTHFRYIKEIIDKSNLRVFCEKPPCTSILELKELAKFDPKDKRRVFFNFNYRYSDLCNYVQSSIKDGIVGNIIHVHGLIAHGLAFKDGYQQSWRGMYPSETSVVLDTSLIHLIDLCNFMFGGSIKIKSSSGSSFKHGLDSFAINLEAKNKANISLYGSYAAPYSFAFKVLGTNGLVEVNDSSINIKSPRDTFDKNGFFISPPVYLSDAYSFKFDYENSLASAVNYFISCIKSGDDFSEKEFDLSLETTKIVLEAQIRP